LEIADSPAGQLTDTQIDATVQRLFLSEDARTENNIQYIRSSIEAIKDRRPLMSLYQQVYAGQCVPEDKRSPRQERLRLIGLVRVEDGVLAVRNEIYRRVFDLAWIRANTPRNLTTIVSMAAAAVMVLALITAVLVYRRQVVEANQVKIEINSQNFLQNSDPDVKMGYLARLCEIDDGTAARALFFDDRQNGQMQRLDLFTKLNAAGAGDNLRVVISCLRPQELDQRLPEPAARMALLQAMRGTICRSDRRDDTQVAQQLGQDFACPAGMSALPPSKAPYERL
jgi:hypothetical protein